MKVLKLVALWFALSAWCEFAQAQVQSRADTIESARTEKEANLKPEAPPKAERDIVWVENSLSYRANSALLITQFCETRHHKVYVWPRSQRPPTKTVARSSFRLWKGNK